MRAYASGLIVANPDLCQPVSIVHWFLLAWITLHGGNCHWDLEPILQMKILCLEKGMCSYLFVDPLAGLMPNSGTYFTLAVLLLRNFARI